jgi:hypothetical protein
MDQTCCVCWEKSNMKTPCGHHICKDCFYYLPKMECPMCRRKFSNIFISHNKNKKYIEAEYFVTTEEYKNILKTRIGRIYVFLRNCGLY